jgi:hypothetical protein
MTTTSAGTSQECGEAEEAGGECRQDLHPRSGGLGERQQHQRQGIEWKDQPDRRHVVEPPEADGRRYDDQPEHPDREQRCIQTAGDQADHRRGHRKETEQNPACRHVGMGSKV